MHRLLLVHPWACGGTSSPCGGAERWFYQNVQQTGGGVHRRRAPAPRCWSTLIICNLSLPWCATVDSNLWIFPLGEPLPAVWTCRRASRHQLMKHHSLLWDAAGRSPSLVAFRGGSESTLASSHLPPLSVFLFLADCCRFFLLSLVSTLSHSACHVLPSFITPPFFYSCFPRSHPHLPPLPVAHTHKQIMLQLHAALVTYCSRRAFFAAAV